MCYKKPQNPNFGGSVFYVEGWIDIQTDITDRHDKLTAAFGKFEDTSKNSTFCPHTVFMCFVWISEQTANISLHNIN